jgi:NADH-quinone oxidoreductase subunit D
MVPVAERLSPLSPFCSSLAFTLTAEALLGLEAPRRGQYIRVALNELARIGSHLTCLREQARAAGAHAASMRAADQRERLAELTAQLTGAHDGRGFLRIGGVRENLPEDAAVRVAQFFAGLEPALDRLGALADRRAWAERTRGLGAIPAEAAVAWGLSGPVLRSAGVARDVRRDEPYSAYRDFDFEVVVGRAGDAYDRYQVRLEEVAQSRRIVDQALGRLPDGPCALADGAAGSSIRPWGDCRTVRAPWPMAGSCLCPGSRCAHRPKRSSATLRCGWMGTGCSRRPGPRLACPLRAPRGNWGFS